MNSRIHRMKALWVTIGLWGTAGALSTGTRAFAAQSPQPPVLSVEKITLSKAIKLLMAQSPDAQIVFVDPEGKLADRVIPFVQIQAKSLEDALKQLCRSISVNVYKDEDGVFVVSEAPIKAAPQTTILRAPGQPEAVPAPEPPPAIEVAKINLQYMDGSDLMRILANSSSPMNRDQMRGAKSLDEINMIPGVVDPVTGQWYQPNSAPPIYSKPGVGMPQLGGSATAGYQIQPGGLGGGLSGGLGGVAPGGLGGGLGGAGGAGQSLIPPNLRILGYPLDNSLIVQGTDQDIADLKTLIRFLDIPAKQIGIKIEQITISTNVIRSLDIDWQVINNDIIVQAPNPNAAPQGSAVPPNSGSIGVGIVGGNFRVRMAALLSEGNATTIDSLTVTTMNNVTASISTSSTSYIFIPNIQLGAGGSGQVTTFTPVPLVVPTIFSATPRINGDGSITMFIPLFLSRTTGEVSTGPNGQEIPNQITSTLFALRRVMSGQTIVVGGTLQRTDAKNMTKIPVLGDLPLVGRLFRPSFDHTRVNREVLFFFTPTILPDPVEVDAVGNPSPVSPSPSGGANR